MTLISVCIPSYNASRHIGGTIQSVLNSTRSDFEIIVNDDASIDDTRGIVTSFQDRRIRFYRNESNVGPARNWNCALQRASGEFVGLLNHDDLYGPFWLAFATHTLKKYPHIGWVGTAFHIINDKGSVLRAISRFDRTREINRDEAFLCMARLDGLTPAYLARREILEEVGYYDEEAGPSADNDLFLRLAARYSLYYSNNPHHATRRLHADNLTHRWGLVDQTGEGLRMLHKAFSDEALPEELRKHKKACYTYFYHKVISRARERLEADDIETVQHLVDLLHTSGYAS